MAFFSVITPFFKPSAPPPTLPIPLAQTELGTLTSIPGKVLAQEEISRLHSRADVSSAPAVNLQHPPYMKPILQRSNRLKPTTKPTALPARYESPSTSSESSSEESDSDDEQIPKPSGEAGRPGRGGYNLEDALDWDPKDFAKLKKCVKHVMCEHLDLTRSYSNQSLALIRVVRDLVVSQFPALNGYSRGWPVIDIIRLHLKYTSGRARLQQQKAAAGKNFGRKQRIKI